MTDADWHSEHARCLGILLSGDQIDEADEQGQPITDDSMVLLLNSSPHDVSFVLPDAPTQGSWFPILDTAHPKARPGRKAAGASLKLTARSVMVLQLRESVTPPEPPVVTRAARRTKSK